MHWNDRIKKILKKLQIQQMLSSNCVKALDQNKGKKQTTKR